MQVSIEQTSNVARKIKIDIPAKDVNAKFREKIDEFKKHAHISGFRPGHVPEKVIRMKYLKAIKGEVLGDFIKDSVSKVIDDEKLNLAEMPNVTSVEPIAENKDLNLVAEVEIFPEFEVKPFTDAKLEKLTTEIKESDIEDTLKTMRERNVSYEEVQRKPKSGDKVEINIKEAVDGNEFPEDFIKDIPIILNEETHKPTVPGFIKGLIDKEVGKEFELKLKFPKDWQDEKYANKKVEYKVVINKVLEQFTPELDDEFAKKYYKLDTLAALKEDVKNKIVATVEEKANKDLKDQALDFIINSHDFEVPKSILAKEVEAFRRQEQEMVKNYGGDLPDDNTLEENAAGRIRLSFVIGEVAKKNNLKPDQDKVKAQIEKVAAQFPAERQSVIDYYYNNKKLLQQLEYEVIVDAVVDLILKEATITEKSLAYKDFANFDRDYTNHNGKKDKKG